MNPLKKKIRDKMLKVAAKKADKSMPTLVKFAVSNDRGYNSLMDTIRNVNKHRRLSKKWIFEVSDKVSR